jgi:hypothetical protein
MTIVATTPPPVLVQPSGGRKSTTSVINLNKDTIVNLLNEEIGVAAAEIAGDKLSRIILEVFHNGFGNVRVRFLEQHVDSDNKEKLHLFGIGRKNYDSSSASPSGGLCQTLSTKS